VYQWAKLIGLTRVKCVHTHQTTRLPLQCSGMKACTGFHQRCLLGNAVILRVKSSCWYFFTKELISSMKTKFPCLCLDFFEIMIFLLRRFCERSEKMGSWPYIFMIISQSLYRVCTISLILSKPSSSFGQFLSGPFPYEVRCQWTWKLVNISCAWHSLTCRRIMKDRSH